MDITVLAAAVLVAAVTVCGLSLAAGLTARVRVRRSHAAGWTAGWAAGWKAGSLPGLVRSPGRWSSVAVAALRPDVRVAVLTLWLIILDSALSLAAPWPLFFVVDYGLNQGRFPAWLAALQGLPAVALAAIAALAGLLLLGAASITGYLTTFLTGALSERMTLRLRGDLFWHVLTAVPRLVRRYPLGELTSRIGPDTRQLSDTVGTVLQTLIPDLTLLGGMTAVTTWMDWRLTLAAGCVIPGYVITARLRNRALRPAQQAARARSGELAALAADQLARLPAIHVFDQGPGELGRHIRAAGRSADAAVAALDASARYRPFIDILPGLGLAAALVAGTAEVSAGRLTVGGLLVFLAYLSSLTGPVHSLSTLSTAIARGSASRDRVAELLRLPVLEPARGSGGADASPTAARGTFAAHRPPALGAHLRLSHVTFGYGDGPDLLSSVDLDLRPGQITCLTGPSGTGKSSLLALLVRLAEPQGGRITIDGHDVAEMPLELLRMLVTLVPQDPWLHSGTIAENIGYGRPGATRAQVMAAADRAGVSAFAADLPAGYETEVGEHGLHLSGGQRRRIAVARALVRDTAALLLDEPTLGLDPVAETHLITGLLAATVGKTVLLVTHQQRLIGLADQVVTLCDGRIEVRQARHGGPNVAANGDGSDRGVFSDRGALSVVTTETRPRSNSRSRLASPRGEGWGGSPR